jgi:hypothetical protein
MNSCVRTHLYCLVASIFKHSNEFSAVVIAGGIFNLYSHTAVCFVGLGRLKLVQVTIVNCILVEKFLLENA